MTKSIVSQEGGEAIPVGKVVCLGRNFAAHAKELGNDVPTDPVIFLKPSTCLIHQGEDIILPDASDNVHEELELGVVISKTTTAVKPENAYGHILGYVLFLDLTARDIQSELKEKRLPWTKAKGYDTFGPVSSMVSKKSVNDPQNLAMKLWINDELKQDGNTSLMIFKIDFLISHISSIMTLEKGDIIATGTPKGVSQIHSGDVVKAEIEDVGKMEFRVR